MNLFDYNPWWQGELDLTYQEWSLKHLKWIPKIIKNIPLQGFGLTFLTGPRQVGKSTSLKILIQDQLKKGTDPHSILYCPCDEILDFLELGEIIDDYLKYRNARGISRSLIILDEITFVKEWWRTLKSRIDNRQLIKDTIIISGSASMELLKEKERFPGRRGLGRDLVLHPLNFRDFVNLFIQGVIVEKLESMTSIKDSISQNLIFTEELNNLFQDYLKTGGFPIPIQDYIQYNKINPNTKKTYLDWMRGDIIRASKNEGLMKEVISYILKSRCTPVSWLSITKEISINSVHTVQSYIHTLESMHALVILYHISPDGSVKFRKNKKIHFIDPFLYRVLSDYVNAEILDETIVESVVAAHFSRAHPTYYWKNSGEIDVISIINDEPVGFEVKWGPKKWKRPLYFNKKHLLTKDLIPLFLATFEWEKY